MPAQAAQDTAQKEFPFTMKEFRYLSSIVYDQTGIVLKDHKINMVYSRLARRLRELGLKSFADYCRLLEGEGGAAESGVFINAITTNLTKFFRESHHFDHLADTALAETVANGDKTGNRRLRIWSAGCSSGEEPYSIAMTLLARVPRLGAWDAKILATDLDTAMVARGKSGTYPKGDLENVPAQYRKRFFTLSDDRSQAVAGNTLRQLITFKQLNLLKPWPMKGPFDAIFCRNVMIYFDEETKTRLIARYAKMLKPGGWLYIGHSETLLDTAGAFQLNGRTIYRRSGS
jgi:chemotaxis protein methyltransferase CheR